MEESKNKDEENSFSNLIRKKFVIRRGERIQRDPLSASTNRTRLPLSASTNSTRLPLSESTNRTRVFGRKAFLKELFIRRGEKL